MKYAIIALSGSQFKATENQIITVSNLDLKEGDTGTIDQVLMVADGDKVSVGTPTVKDAAVEYKVVKNYKGDKLKIFKYKSKSRYRLTNGFRALQTDIQITKITG